EEGTELRGLAGRTGQGAVEKVEDSERDDEDPGEHPRLVGGREGSEAGPEEADERERVRRQPEPAEQERHRDRDDPHPGPHLGRDERSVAHASAALARAGGIDAVAAAGASPGVSPPAGLMSPSPRSGRSAATPAS